VSESSVERISSGLTSGLVASTGIVQFSLATGASSVPGSSWMNMSFRPVLGRSSAVASVWIMSLYSASMSIRTIARPSSSSTSPMSPIRTPATRTVWPWPAITAWAVWNSAFSTYGLSWMIGNRSRWLLRM
jgi:hypothetical protein